MLTILARIYGFFVRRRNERFDTRSVPIVQVDIPVISVGNITTGGTGKTPVVQWIVRLLQSQGRSPAIVLRGYKRRSRGLLVVHDGEQLLADVNKAGDEAMLHARTLGVPVVVCSSKVDAAVHAAGFLPCDVIVIDDGFQHRSLHRDIDVVVMDETPAAKLQLLPKGVLREPLENVGRADVVVRIATRLNAVYPLGDGATSGNGARLGDGSNSGDVREAVRKLNQMKRVLPVTGIANPSRFVDAIRSYTENTVLEPMLFSDHHRYSKADVTAMISSAQSYDASIVTTEKDAVKLEAFSEQFSRAGVAVYVVAVRAEILDGEEKLIDMIMERVINEDSSVESVG
jgi:tetraacyldisaccharide 4'-kinase